MMGENHIGPGFIFLYLGARYIIIIIILIIINIIIIAFTTIFIIRVDDLNNAPWIEGMYFVAAFIYAVTILLYWSLRKRWSKDLSVRDGCTKRGKVSFYKTTLQKTIQYLSGEDGRQGESWRTTSTRSLRVPPMGSQTSVSLSVLQPLLSRSLSSSSIERFNLLKIQSDWFNDWQHTYSNP